MLLQLLLFLFTLLMGLIRVLALYAGLFPHPPLCPTFTQSKMPLHTVTCSYQSSFSLPRLQICVRYGQEILEAKMKRPAI